MSGYKLKVTRHTDKLWRYKWEVQSQKGLWVNNNFTITIWGARFGARKAIKYWEKTHQPKSDEEIILEEEL